MFRTFRLNAVVVPLVALVAILSLASHRAEAQVKPFKVKGGAGGEGAWIISCHVRDAEPGVLA